MASLTNLLIKVDLLEARRILEATNKGLATTFIDHEKTIEESNSLSGVSNHDVQSESHPSYRDLELMDGSKTKILRLTPVGNFEAI